MIEASEPDMPARSMTLLCPENHLFTWRLQLRPQDAIQDANGDWPETEIPRPMCNCGRPGRIEASKVSAILMQLRFEYQDRRSTGPSSIALLAVCRRGGHLFTCMVSLPELDDGADFTGPSYTVAQCPYCGSIGDIASSRVSEAYRQLRGQAPPDREVVWGGPLSREALLQLVLELADRQPAQLTDLAADVDAVEGAATSEEAAATLAAKPSLLALLRPGTHEEMMEQVRLIGRVVRWMVYLGVAVVKGPEAAEALLQVIFQPGFDSP